MPEPALTVQKPFLLLVEGKEDERFFQSFLKHLNMLSVQVLAIGGKDGFKRNLKAVMNDSGFPQVIALGIARDADADARAAFQNVCSTLRECKLPVPNDSFEIAESKKPIVGVMVLPDKDCAGALEDLCLQSVLSHPAYRCVDRYFECLAAVRSIPPDFSLGKAKVQVLLAAVDKEKRRMGEAAEAGMWDFDDAAFEQVGTFMRRLFGE